MPLHRHHHRQRGFTLAEVLVATAIFTIVMVAALMLYDRSNRVFKESVESASMQQEARVSFDKLIRDVRMVGFDFDRDGLPMIEGATVWTTGTAYVQGRVVIPVIPNGYFYQAVNGGTSHATTEPVWPETPGDTVIDNASITWRAIQAVYQQPDEQVEYAGFSAITLRGNLDYTTAFAAEHGRERNYEPGGGQFPIVTTGNDEIVTYALKSDAPGAPNNDTLRFWADVARPRQTFPGAGGAVETEVTIGGLDLCNDSATAPQCTNPPYTLYRYTLSDGTDGNPIGTAIGTPVASNIRSLKFFYYTTPLGGLTDADSDGLQDELVRNPTTNAEVVQGAIGGDGRYDPNNVGAGTNFDHRTARDTIASIRVQLIGMSEAPDRSYTNPSEAAGSPLRQYRTYQLESLVIPRNIGLRGMREPQGTAPTPPHVRFLCEGYCNATRIAWDAPTTGTVTLYEIRRGTSWSSSNRALPDLVDEVPGNQLVWYVDLPETSPAGGDWWVNVRAINEYGQTDADNALQIGASINKTKPLAPTSLEVTDDDNGMAQPNRIGLRWNRVSRNDETDPDYHTLACVGTGGSTDGRVIPAQETIQYRIYRGRTPDFAIADAEIVLDNGPGFNNPNITGGMTEVTWVDDASGGLGVPPANCVQYYYRIQAYDLCTLPAENEDDDVTLSQSAIFRPIGDPSGAHQGYAGYLSPATPTAPTTPASLTVDESASSCAGPTCSIVLTWPRVMADAFGTEINVDRYEFMRERKTAATAWALDSVFTIDNLAGSSANVTHTDPVPSRSPSPGSRRYFYRYKVKARNCTAESGYNSAWAYYPGACANPSVVNASGSGTGETIDDPWMMSDGIDYVQVTPTGGADYTNVRFVLTDPGDVSGTALQTVDVNGAPWTYSWSGSPGDPSIPYELTITITQDSGCVEEFVYYVQDEPAICTIPTVTVANHNGGSGVSFDPYILNGDDVVTVTEAADAPLTSVEFQLFDSSDNPIGSAVTDSNTPYEYTYVDRTDRQRYRLSIRPTFADGCPETVPDLHILDEVCSGAGVTPTGQLSGDGIDQFTPWIFSGGDQLQVDAPADATISRITYTVTPVDPAGPSEPPIVQGSEAFVWTERTSGTVYKISMLVEYSFACEETIVKYVKDEPRDCSLTVDDPDGTIIRAMTPVNDNQLQLDLRNNANAALVVSRIAITWVRPAGMTWANVTFPSNTIYAVTSSTSSTQTIAPAGGDRTLAAGSTTTLRLNFTETGSRPPMATSAITKVCVTYTRADSGLTFVCRILNSTTPDESPNNPTTCD